MSTRDLKNRFIARDHNGTTLGRFPQKRQAIDRARQEARRSGRECDVFDSCALVGDVEKWAVPPSGTIQAIERRSIESEKRDLQAGVER